MTKSDDFALVSDERDHTAADDLHRQSIRSFQLEQRRMELSDARLTSLRQRGAMTRSCGSNLDDRRYDLIVFYGRLARRETAIQASIMLCEMDALEQALKQEVALDEDSLDGEEIASVDPLDALTDHLETLIAVAAGETADWRVAA